MTYDKDKLDQQNRDVLQRNIEQSKKLIEEREAEAVEAGLADDADRPVGAPAPAKENRQPAEPTSLPGQENVPAGGTSGMGQDWGGKRANRRG